MLHRLVSTVGQNGQTKHSRAPFAFFAGFVATVGSPKCFQQEGWGEGIFSWLLIATSLLDAAKPNTLVLSKMLNVFNGLKKLLQNIAPILEKLYRNDSPVKMDI